MIVKSIVIIFALIAPFLFPWPLTVALALIAAYFFPPVVLVIGALTELLYGSGSIPYVFLGSLVAFFMMAGVRRIVKARIMGA